MRPSDARKRRAMKIRGRRECQVRAAPAVSCARCTNKNAHEHTGSAETLRHSLRDGFTAYAAISPETNSFLPPSSADRCFAKPGRANQNSADLTPATGARTTRFCCTLQRRSSACCHRSRENPPCDSTSCPTLPRPPHPRPNVHDDGQRPLAGQDGGSCSFDLPGQAAQALRYRILL